MGLLDILTGGMNLLDLPGSTVRDLIAGRDPLDQWADPFGSRASSNRIDGRQMLADWGITSRNDPNAWELADFLGFGAQVATDPLTFVPAGALAAVLGLGRKAAPVADDAMRAFGGIDDAIPQLDELDQLRVNENASDWAWEMGGDAPPEVLDLTDLGPPMEFPLDEAALMNPMDDAMPQDWLPAVARSSSPDRVRPLMSNEDISPNAPPFYSRAFEAANHEKVPDLIKPSTLSNLLLRYGAPPAELDLVGIDELARRGLPIEQDEIVARFGEFWNNLNPTENRLEYPRFSDYRNLFGENYGETLLTHSEMSRTTPDFYTSHWPGTPNVFAHARHSDWQGPHGKTLLLEEIQSDWAKSLATKHYDAPAHELSDRIDALGLDRHGDARYIARALGVDQWDEALWRALRQEFREPPRTPFADNWDDVMLRNMIRRAAEEDYAGIALHTGDEIRGLVGGKASGQRAFYDQAIPNKLTKIGKPFGATVEPTAMNSLSFTGVTSPPRPYMPITEELRRHALTKGFPLLATLPVAAGAAGLADYQPFN